MQEVLIVGGGKGGTAILQILHEVSVMKVIAVVDLNENASGILLAKELGIPVGNDWRQFLNDSVDIVIEVTGEQKVFENIRDKRAFKCVG